MADAPARTKRWRANNQERARRLEASISLKKKYGITLEEFEKMAAAQGNLCAICCRPEPHRKRLSVDHCHKTGKIRALLCSQCNTAIGLFREQPALLRAAIAYLEKHQCSE